MIANYIINKKIKQANKILDVGCGKGAWGDLADDRCFFGIDINTKNNPEHYLETFHCNLDTTEFVFKNHTFDLVIAKDILEHLHNPMKTLLDIKGVMEEGSTLIVKVPDYRSKNAWGDYTHVRPYNKGAIIQMVSDAGFEVEKVVRLGGYFLPRLITQAFSWLVVARK